MATAPTTSHSNSGQAPVNNTPILIPFLQNNLSLSNSLNLPFVAFALVFLDILIFKFGISNKTNVSPGFNGLDFGIVIAFLSLIISLISLNHLTLMRGEHGILLFIIFASQFNDIAQFLCGRYLGNRFFTQNLAPSISPNKTIEGAIFGSLVSACLATAFGVWLTPFSSVTCFAIAYSLSVSGILGDLCESAFKRRHGIKDIGTLLAGHGGQME